MNVIVVTNKTKKVIIGEVNLILMNIFDKDIIMLKILKKSKLLLEKDIVLLATGIILG